MHRFLFVLLVLFAPCFADDAPKNTSKILDHVFYNLNCVGTIKQGAGGMVYVDVDDDFILKLYPLIQDEGFVLPTSLQGKNAIGAHITVVYNREANDYDLGWIEERNTQVFFTVTDCKIVELDQAGYESACVLKIKAPNLDKLRKKYGLPAIKYDFHIMIGMKPSDP